MDRIGTDILIEALREGAAPEVWVRFPRQLGDVIFSLPFFLQLQRRWNEAARQAGASLRWIAVGHDIGASLFTEADPTFIAESVIESKGEGKPDPWFLYRRWKERRPVAVINLSQSVRLILAATMARVPIRAGIADNHLGSLYTHPFKYRDLPLHCALRYTPLLAKLTGAGSLCWERMSSTMLGGRGGFDKLRAAGWQGGRYVCLAFGTRGDAKRWLPEPETWPELARILLDEGFGVVWLGSPGERATGQTLCALAPGSIDLTGQTTIPEAFSILESAYGTVAIDTGLAHLSAGAGRPTVTINSHSPEPLIQPLGPHSIMTNGPMIDLFEGQSSGWALISPPMRRIPPRRAALLLHAMAAEAGAHEG